MALKKPNNKPQLERIFFENLMLEKGLSLSEYPLIIFGIRGYYKNTMGKPKVNDRGIYDDAIFVLGHHSFASFNANTDPSVTRPGVAVMEPGVYPVYKYDTHRGAASSYPAICQRFGPVSYKRDGNPEVLSGRIGLNIHRGGYNNTSSLGCQTIYPDQFPLFLSTCASILKHANPNSWTSTVIPYVLMN